MSGGAEPGTRINRDAWRDGDYVSDYATTAIVHVEQDILDRYRADLSAASSSSAPGPAG